MGFKSNALGGILHQDVSREGSMVMSYRGDLHRDVSRGGSMVTYREVCPEGVQNKCPGEVWCRGFMSWGDTLILVISRGVQLYYGVAQ